MFCPQCGKEISARSSFCKFCGVNLETLNRTKTGKKVAAEIDQNTPPYPYIVSTAKLTILSILTFGLYEIYWFYRQWKSFKEEKNLKVTVWARAFFSGITAYSLFKEISKAVEEHDKNKTIPSGVLAVIYFVLLLFGRAPDWGWIISLLSFMALVPAQNAINFYWERRLKGKAAPSNFGASNYIWSIVGGLFLLLALYGTFFPESQTSLSMPETNYDAAPAVVQDQTNEDEFRQSYMSSCEDPAGAIGYCSCTYAYLQARYSLEEIAAMGQEYENSDEVPEAFVEAATYCLDQNQL